MIDQHLQAAGSRPIPPLAGDLAMFVPDVETGPLADEVAGSWIRSVREHGIDPIDIAPPHILTAGEIKGLRQPLDELIASAGAEFDRLHMLVRQSGYALLFCDMNGAVVEHRGDEAQANQFGYWGVWLGGVWSESAEGTNGIGTCIAEERPATIHRSQHFRVRNKELSCSGAPVFGVDGRMLAVLDVSAIDPDLSERGHGLTGMLTTAAAGAIEERYFREHFRRRWIVAAALPVEESASPILLAVDADQRIVGANRFARKSFALDDQQLRAGASLWGLFERDLEPFRHHHAVDVATQLTLVGSFETLPTLVTPPIGARSGDPGSSAYHTHPRAGMLAQLRQAAPPQQARGGLPPGSIRRVAEYIDGHMSENIDLATLAGVAGLSLYHFAREFKRSTGATPHLYLVRRRIERAQNMLARTDRSLAEIALAVGFADQSHLARHFRQTVGVTPREFRWSQR